MTTSTVPSRTTGTRLSRTASAPVLLVVAAALCLSTSATLVTLSAADADTAAFVRCALALLVLGPLAAAELRARGRVDRGVWWMSAAGGIFLGIDYLMWTVGILDAGAGVATVLINVQVIVFPVLCRLLDAERLSRRFVASVPLMLAGLALAGGLAGADAGSAHALRGALLSLAAGVAYSGYLYLSRRSTRRGTRHVVTPVAVATAAAAATIGLTGLASDGIALSLPTASWLWLVALAVVGQVLPWLLLAAGSRSLAPNTVAALLLLQPVLAMFSGVVVLGESPTAAQWAGAATTVAAVWLATGSPARRIHRDRRPAPAPPRARPTGAPDGRPPT